MAFALPRKSRGDRPVPSPASDRAHELQSVLQASRYQPTQAVPSSTPHVAHRPQAFAQDVSASLTPSTPRRALRPYGEFPAPNWSASRQSAASMSAATPLRSPRAPAPMTILDDDDDADRDAPTASFARDYVEAPLTRGPFVPRPQNAPPRPASPPKPLLTQAPLSPVSSTDDPLLLHEPRMDLSIQAAQGDASLLAMVRRFEREDLGLTSTATPRRRPLSSFRDDTPRRARPVAGTPLRGDARRSIRQSASPGLYDRSLGVSERLARLRSPQVRASPTPALSPAPWAPDWEPSLSHASELSADAALDGPDLKSAPESAPAQDDLAWAEDVQAETEWDPAQEEPSEEQAAAEWAEVERVERERAEAERVERERAERERAERERAERERAERERAERERAERERAERERAERERAERERAERERAERERAERERLELERAERERLELERAERERLELERAEQERFELERAEQERLELERAEAEQAEREQAEAEQAEREQAEAEWVEAERAERKAEARAERQAKRAVAEQAELEQVEAEWIETDRAKPPMADEARQARSSGRPLVRPTNSRRPSHADTWLERPTTHLPVPAQRRRPRKSQTPVYMNFDQATDLPPSPSSPHAATHDTSWMEPLPPSPSYTPSLAPSPHIPEPHFASRSPAQALDRLDPAMDAWLDGATTDVGTTPPPEAETLEANLHHLPSADLRSPSADDAPLRLDELTRSTKSPGEVPRARTPKHAVSLAGALARRTPSPVKSAKARRVPLTEGVPRFGRPLADQPSPTRSAGPRAASVPLLTEVEPPVRDEPLAEDVRSPWDLGASMSASLPSRAMMLARPYPTSCIEVSSLDPMAAARAAAILKVHHQYIQEGYLGETESLYPALPGDVSTTLPALLDAAEQALRPAPNPLRAEARAGHWSNAAWAQLDHHFRAHLRAGQAAEVDVDAVIASFLEAEGLEPDDLQGAWTLTRLYARVPALQARYLREQEQDAAEAMRERSFQWLSQRTKRTCDAASHEAADEPPIKRVRTDAPLWHRLWGWIAGRSSPTTPSAPPSHPVVTPRRRHARSRLPRPRSRPRPA